MNNDKSDQETYGSEFSAAPAMVDNEPPLDGNDAAGGAPNRDGYVDERPRVALCMFPFIADSIVSAAFRVFEMRHFPPTTPTGKDMMVYPVQWGGRNAIIATFPDGIFDMDDSAWGDMGVKFVAGAPAVRDPSKGPFEDADFIPLDVALTVHTGNDLDHFARVVTLCTL